MEEYVFILDFLPKGRGDVPPHRRYPVVYGIGENQFTLLELVPKNNTSLNIGDRIYVGKDPDKRVQIKKIKGEAALDLLALTGNMETMTSDEIKKGLKITLKHGSNAKIEDLTIIEQAKLIREINKYNGFDKDFTKALEGKNRE